MGLSTSRWRHWGHYVVCLLPLKMIVQLGKNPKLYRETHFFSTLDKMFFGQKKGIHALFLEKIFVKYFCPCKVRAKFHVCKRATLS